jgi:lipid II:glycine glycyltransferase (peptidoglycan interpeptide bridge formation enzyme)
MFDLPLGLMDVRPFIWQQKNNEKIKSSIEIKYTAVLEIIAYEKILKSFRQERRRELLKINKKDLKITFNSHDTTEICDFYKSNIESFNFSPFRESMLKSFLNMQPEEGVVSIQVNSEKDMKLVGFVLMGIYRGTCNVILNMCDKNFKGNKSFLPTFLTDQIIQYACEKDLKTIDFNGANSPRLADSKHSFGAYPKLFFRITTQFG